MELTIPFPFQFFEALSDNELENQLETDDTKRNRKQLACAVCKAPITSEEEKVEVKGGHEHDFFNPYGIIFRIGCFGAAPGCRPTGSPTSDFSWFPGYRWNLAYCYSCQTHLGWAFSASNSGFWGLILNRLTETATESET